MALGYKNLYVWKLSYRLALDVYEVTKSFPAEERNNIVSQLRRAAVSLPVNIAEGSSSRYCKSFLSQLNVALCSAREIENLLLLSKDLGFLDAAAFARLESLLSRLVHGLLKLSDYVSALVSKQERARVNSLGSVLKKEWFYGSRSVLSSQHHQ
ncbi:MAG TPA: four helix bundle protein [Candidatus Nanoarchaeia archaeon]|nr:four helix bundle protein [Candidatus Nanoarchaeia archaeon]